MIKKKVKPLMLGSQLLKERKRLGMTQTELATALGYTNYVTIWLKEKGKRKINGADIKLLFTLKPKTK